MRTFRNYIHEINRETLEHLIRHRNRLKDRLSTVDDLEVRYETLMLLLDANDRIMDAWNEMILQADKFYTQLLTLCDILMIIGSGYAGYKIADWFSRKLH